MSKVSVTAVAENLRPLHTKHVVCFPGDSITLVLLPEGVDEAWPARARVVLLVTVEERSTTAHTGVGTLAKLDQFKPAPVLPLSLFSLYLPVQARSVPCFLATLGHKSEGDESQNKTQEQNILR